MAGLSNAYNMIDGIDGLAAATIALPLLVLYALALQAGHPMADFLLLMLVPLAVFLLFNLGPNNRLLPKIFLGDGGSVTLGFLVTASLVYFSQGEQALIQPVTALWLVTLPLMDMLATMLRRARRGRKLMEADRSHLHHTLMDMGLSPRQTLVVLVSYATVCALLGWRWRAFPEYLSLACYFLLFPRPLPVCASVEGRHRLRGPSAACAGNQRRATQTLTASQRLTGLLQPAPIAINPVSQQLVQGIGGAPQVAHRGQPAGHQRRASPGAGSRWARE